MKHLQTREQKVRFLNDLAKGKTSASSILNPVTAVVFVDQHGTFAEVTLSGIKQRVDDVESFKKKHPNAVTHEVIFKNYSTGDYSSQTNKSIDHGKI